MQELSFDPHKPATEKLNAQPAEAPAPDRTALIAAIAERVRADSRERGMLTPEHVFLGIAGDLPREQITSILADMARDPSCDDIMGVVTPAGRFYLFSTAHLTAAEAWRRAHIEDAKLAIAARIRSDSRKTTLTSLTDLEPLFPSAEPAERAALLAELEADDRFHDLQKLEGPKGETYYHCETHLTGAYALIMMRAKTHDVSLAIAELVRDRSRILPRPTSIATFRDPVFGIDLALLDEAVARTLARHADIRKLVHPETGAAYLYSSRWLDDVQAFSMIDWEEVGAARNP